MLVSWFGLISGVNWWRYHRAGLSTVDAGRSQCGDTSLQAAMGFSSTVGEWPPKAGVGYVSLSPVVTWGLQTQ